MKTDSNNTKLSRKVIDYIVFIILWLTIFPVVVMAGIIDKISNKVNAHKVNANTRVISDQSKIVPKNTNKSLSSGEAIGEEFNYYPDRSVK